MTPMTFDPSTNCRVESETDDAVYLIVREGLKWRNVFRLTAGQVTTIGRAPTNRIVVADDLCSRHHCEVFQTEVRWILRDLGSRNGTQIRGNPVSRDTPLTEGDEIQIGEFSLVFTTDISQAELGDIDLDDNTDTYEGGVKRPHKATEPEILLRRRDTRFHSGTQPESASRDRMGRELAKLYRLALVMAKAKDAKQLAETVLDGLLDGPQADIGAVLLLPQHTNKPAASQLHLIAYRSVGNEVYETVSSSMTDIVLQERQAILANDIQEDSRLSGTASLQKMQARSVICAPIRTASGIYGVVHLYTTHGGHSLDGDDLEYTLAVTDQFAIALENLQQKESLSDGLAKARNENESLRSQLAVETEFVGDSPAVRQLKDSISRIAPTDATVLIRGESGVGKELVARAIHFGSERRNGPYICMNCAALTESLLESELFGHEKGSFTGATGRKLGKFEQAHGGTLFLDEVGEMSLAIQSKFLRVLEGHSFERVGGGTPIKTEVRVVAATNRDLEKAIEEKAFRRDLFYRLFVVEVAIPSLRERPTDIPILANYFLNRFAKKVGRRIQGYTESAMKKLCVFEWPGNVRELQNTIERSVILSSGGLIDVDDILLSSLASITSPALPEAASEIVVTNRDISLDSLEREHILATLERTNWNKSLTAQMLGIERSTLDRKLKRYQVGRPSRSS